MSQIEIVNPMPWALVIFACRETSLVLIDTLRSAIKAAEGTSHIDLLVNGNPALAEDAGKYLGSLSRDGGRVRVRLWSMPLADKGNAWNQYVHQIWSNESLSFFIDGYVRLNSDALSLLGNAVLDNNQVLGGTGVPSVGRTAKRLRDEMLNNGGFHGNLCCIKSDALRRLRDRGIRLPLGMYRVDSLMGAFLCFGLDPQHNDWEPRRIYVHPSASWKTDAKIWWRPDHLQSKFRQTLRQAQGVLENLAVKDHFVSRRLNPESLIDHSHGLVLDWAARRVDQVRELTWRRPLARFMLAQMKTKQPHPVSAKLDALFLGEWRV